MTNTFITSTDLNNALHSTNLPLVFDVRKKPAFDADPQLISSASWQIHDQVKAWAQDLSSDKTIVVYCVHGHEVSQNAAQQLRDLGFNARYLKDGFDGWVKAEFALTQAAIKGVK